VTGLRIFHLADTHLGFTAYQRLVPEGEPWEGLNQREADIYAAWHKVVEAALEAGPDVVIHSGDLFDSVRPSNRALHEAISGLRRLTHAGIPVVVIAGNHETPRLRETGHVFRLLENFEGIHPIYKGPPEAVELPGLENLRVVGVPHSHSGMTERIARAFPDEQYINNILVLHGIVAGLTLPSRELNQAEIESGLLKSGWDYIALGHYHGFTRIEPNAYYCGSTERTSFAEVKEAKGYAMVELPDLKVTHQELPVREFVDLPWLDCAQLLRLGQGGAKIDEVIGGPPVTNAGVGGEAGTKPSASQAQQPTGQLTFDEWGSGTEAEQGALKATGSEPSTMEVPRFIDLNHLLQKALEVCRPTGKVIRQKVLNCPPELYRLVDFQRLKKLTAAAIHYQPQFELAAAGEAVQAPSASIGHLVDEFKDYMTRQPLEGLDRERIEALGRQYLAEAGGGP